MVMRIFASHSSELASSLSLAVTVAVFDFSFTHVSIVESSLSSHATRLFAMVKKCPLYPGLKTVNEPRVSSVVSLNRIASMPSSL